MDNNDDDLRIRAETERHAPRPSASHDAAILRAAKTRATAHSQQPRTRQRRWLVAGASLAASVVIAVGLLQTQSTVEPNADRSVRGDLAAAWPSENAELTSPPTMFRWEEQAGAERYQVRLHNDAAELVWSSNWVTTTQVSIDDNAASIIAAGERYFWIVGIEGSVTSQSLGPYWFRIN